MGQREFKQQEASHQFSQHCTQHCCHWVYDWAISVARWALAGNDASLDPRQARALPALWRIESGWKGSQWILKKKNPFKRILRSTGCLCGRSLFCSLFFCSLLHLRRRICWGLQVPQRPLRKDDKTGGSQDFYRRALSKLAGPRPGPRCSPCPANSPHQQKDKRSSAIIRFKGWLQWMGKSKWSHCTLMEELGVSWGSASDQCPGME